ncbi:MAG: NYN domain-containing protein [Defluviitaleaceae bacterium]|nr:NYN domain-containing protein [Defluviitaleaceae bacterium]
MIPNTAIFYDIENLIGPFTGKANTILQLDEIYRRVLATEGVEGVSIQRAYADWVLPLHRNLRGSVLQVGIEPVQIFNTNPHDKIKNAADVALIIDAVELIAKRPEITHYVIASGDGIFAFLAKKLHEHGKRVIGIGFDRIVNMIFRNACDVYVGLEKTDKSLVTSIGKKKSEVKQDNKAENDEVETPETATAESKTSKSTVKQTPQPAPKPHPIPEKFPKTKYSEVMVAANVPIWRDLADASGTLMVVRQLLEVLHAEETAPLPDLEISVFMTYLKHYIPGFTSKRFNYPHFSNFMRFMLTGSPLTLYSVENSHKIARRDNVDTKGETLEDVEGLQFVTPDATRYASIFDIPVGSQFVYTVNRPQQNKNAVPEKKPAKPSLGTQAQPKPRTVKPTSKPKVVEAAPQPADTPPIVMDEGSVRKWIKNQFMELSNEDKISSAEARRMTTEDYAQKTFGIRTPIFREIKSHSNLTEQRSVNGKVKYWKESFKYNGKFYLVYKEWVVTLHADRFAAWLVKVKK